MTLVFIEGSIGAGKTTSINRLVSENNNYVKVLEPVEEWENSGMLAKFYGDMKNNAFEFQLYVLETLFMRLKNTTLTDCGGKKKIYLCERSIYTCYYVFTKNMKNCGFINEHQFSIIKNKFNEYDEWIKNNFNDIKFILLHTDVDECIERIKYRNRQNEKESITKGYLETLETLHLDMFLQLLADGYNARMCNNYTDIKANI